MTTTLPGLIVPLEARIDKLEKGFARANRLQRRTAQSMERRAKKSADRIGATYSKMGDGIGAGFKKMAVPLLAGVASAGTLRAIAATTKGVAQLGDEAKRAGVPLKDFQEWKFVAEQNRIGIDQMVDGLKELNIRADEFVITGKGPAAEAFARLGFGADELKEKLKNPSDLLLEIMGRMKRLNTSGRIRVADELFGGSAGERFVELVDQGEDGLRRTVDRAHELGLVLGDEVVAKADEVSRKFDELTARISAFGKRFAVAIADGITEAVDLRAKLDEIFASEGQGRAILGDELFDNLVKNRDVVEEEVRDLEALSEAYGNLGDTIFATSAELSRAANLAKSYDYGYDEFADDLAQAATDMGDLSSQFRSGSISGEEFAQKLDVVQQSADKAFAKLDEADKVMFDVAISQVSRLGGVLKTVIGSARSLKSALKDVSGLTPTKSPEQIVNDGKADAARDRQIEKEKLDGFLQIETERNAKSRERLDIEREILEVQKRAKEAGITLTNAQAEEGAKAKIAADALRRDNSRSSRNSGAQQSDFESEVTAIAEETAALRIEAQELAKTTGAQIKHGDAMDLARTKAELLAAALRSGLADTPALRTQIDQLATEYNEAGQAAELAADKIADVQAASQRGADSITSVFEGMATGALTAKEAVGKLILEVIKLTFKKRLLEMVGNAGGFLGNIIGVIGGGFAGGGYTGNGGKFEPAGVVHRGEFVMSKSATKSIGVGNLETLHRAAKSGFASGGYVGGAAPLRPRPATRSESLGAININAPITVNGSSGTPEQNDDLAKKIARQMEGAMRGTVMDELRRQGRPGNMLNNRRR